MSTRDRRAALRAVHAAANDAGGKLLAPEPLPVAPEPEPAALPEPAPPAAVPAAVSRRAAAIRPRLVPQPEPEPVAQPAGLEALLPDEWRRKVDQATSAEAVEVHGERVRRRVEEEMVYLAVRVPRSLRDAVHKRADRLDVPVQEFVVRACRLMLDATARAAE
ncbi:MAG: hypothetical protein HYU66_18120 [Armatimonadetes bacterium]|nr:hypothetical protein [Armatimonadota bacterium]